MGFPFAFLFTPVSMEESLLKVFTFMYAYMFIYFMVLKTATPTGRVHWFTVGAPPSAGSTILPISLKCHQPFNVQPGDFALFL